jgi:tRNA A-37 threonylcarbamoyl transferase component Bud32
MMVLMGKSVVVKTGDVVEGRYRIIKTLGGGGIGTVFLAEHALIKRKVAIKILHPELAIEADVVEHFMNEARAAGTLGHPNIVESTDMGFTADRVPYIVFDYLEGVLLTDEVYRVGGLPVRRAVKIAQQITSALQAAHKAGIVHRDLKSDNVFLTDKDEMLDHVKVLDFGTSRFQTRGSPEFMAPEQFTSPATVDHRADIYALGVILYEMVTAMRPFTSDDRAELMHRITNNAPPALNRAEVPPALAELIFNKLLAKNPDDRFQSMSEVEQALDAFGAAEVARRKRTSNEEHDVSRNSDLIPRPAKMVDTPWPPTHASQLQQVALPPPPAAYKPWLLYGMAAFGLLVGGIGLAVGLKSGSSEQAAPVATPAPLPAAAMPAPREVAAPAKVSVALEANVPGARVTFRRRVSPAPAAMQIAPSDIVELVEVSAPGYKTLRYWLTFDRPTHLTAKLTRGSGLEEASEETTLIALGEVAAPVVVAAAPSPAPVVAPAAAPMPVMAKTVEPEEVKVPEPVKAAAIEPVAVAPRKIGRVAAEELAAAEPIAAMTEPAAVEPAVAEPVAAPEPTPAPEPIKVAEPVVAKPEPVAEPAVARPAIDRATVSSVVGQHRMEILTCFAEGKKKNPAMKGTVTLQLQVDTAGRVRAQVQSTLNNPLVAACAIKAANTWQFPARASGELAQVAYPFTIN